MRASNESRPRLTALKGWGSSRPGCLLGSAQHGGYGVQSEPGAARIGGPERVGQGRGAGHKVLLQRDDNEHTCELSPRSVRSKGRCTASGREKALHLFSKQRSWSWCSLQSSWVCFKGPKT